MNTISRILLVGVIITCLFVGLAAAGTKSVYVTDSDGNKVINKHVSINRGNTGYECDTDNKGICRIEDKVRNGDKGKSRDRFGNEVDCKVKDGTEIPEYPTVALPIAATIGLVYIFQLRKNKE